jgi:hypothetical protein
MPNKKAALNAGGRQRLVIRTPLTARVGELFSLCRRMKSKFPASETASVWLGDFTDEDEFDDHVKSDVEAKLQLSTELWKVSEIAVEKEETTIVELLTGFSHSEFFLDEAIATANQKGIASASSALVVFYLALRDAPDSWGSLRLLGSFGKEK